MKICKPPINDTVCNVYLVYTVPMHTHTKNMNSLKMNFSKKKSKNKIFRILYAPDEILRLPDGYIINIRIWGFHATHVITQFSNKKSFKQIAQKQPERRKTNAEFHGKVDTDLVSHLNYYSW